MINQKILKKRLEMQGHLVFLTENGSQCVSTYINSINENESSFHVILMDIKMPVMSGTEATEKIRLLEAKAARRSIPIIGISADVEYDDCLKCGMTGYLSKPIDFPFLSTMLLNAQQSQFPPSEQTLHCSWKGWFNL